MIKTLSFSNSMEKNLRKQLFELFKKCPIPDNELFANLGIFLSRWQLGRILNICELYEKTIDIQGDILEFGCRWGQNLVLWKSMMSLFDPYNITRKIVGFDTFKGFKDVHEKDGNHPIIDKNNYNTTVNYQDYLKQILEYHRKINPNSNFDNCFIYAGDASEMIKNFLDEYPETIIAMVYFDMDVYEPTKKVLERIMPYLTKGSIVVFDELGMKEFPGETIAFREVFGSKYKLNKCKVKQTQSYLIIE